MCVLDLIEKWYKDCIQLTQRKGRYIPYDMGMLLGNNRGTPCLLIVKSADSFVYRALLRFLLSNLSSNQYHHGPQYSHPSARQCPNPQGSNHQKLFSQALHCSYETPSYPPNLSPSEHTWVELKRTLHHKYPHLSDTSGGSVKVCEKLAIILSEVWDETPSSHFEKLVQSMPDQVAAVMGAKGWYTRY